VNGEVIDVTPQKDSRARSRRNRIKNIRYSKDWWVDNQGSDDEEDLVDDGGEYKGNSHRRSTRKVKDYFRCVADFFYPIFTF
jgi:hypothetical protein